MAGTCYTCLWVQTGSMEPTIPTKSYILVKKTDAADCTVGDVIVFVCRDADSPVYGSLVTHRIDEVTPEGFRTKGDSVLSAQDPWVVEPDDVVAVYVRNLAVLTFFGRIFSSWFGLYLIIGILILSCAFLYIPDIVRGIREVETEERDAEIARRVEQEVQRQEAFTAAFAHELKTPLTSIIGYADTIRQMDLSKEETDMCADYIFRQGKRLQTLSYKLLEMTMAEAQKLERKEIPIPELVEELKRVSAVSLTEKQMTLIVDAQSGSIFGDRDLLLSLFLNLIDNARKASEPGGRIWLLGDRLQDGYQITVQDEGRGIEPEELARITEAFYMVDKSRSRKEGGAGLGLALCKKIVELHQAAWRFYGSPGEGFAVTVRFWQPEMPARRMRRKPGSAGKVADKGENG